MLLENTAAVIDGAGRAIGGAVARAFAREGARVFLAGRTLAAQASTKEENYDHADSQDRYRIRWNSGH